MPDGSKYRILYLNEEALRRDTTFNALSALMVEHAHHSQDGADSVVAEAEYLLHVEDLPEELALATAITARLCLGRYVQ